MDIRYETLAITLTDFDFCVAGSLYKFIPSNHLSGIYTLIRLSESNFIDYTTYDKLCKHVRIRDSEIDSFLDICLNEIDEYLESCGFENSIKPIHLYIKSEIMSRLDRTKTCYNCIYQDSSDASLEPGDCISCKSCKRNNQLLDNYEECRYNDCGTYRICKVDCIMSYVICCEDCVHQNCKYRCNSSFDDCKNAIKLEV